MPITLAALAWSFIHATPVPVRQPGAIIHEAIASDPHSVELVKRASAGFNNWNCKPSTLHPHALVLVHGLSANAIDNWLYMALDLSPRATVSLHSAMVSCMLSDHVDRVLKATNTTQVDLFGHSQVLSMSLDKFAAIGSIQYGTDILGLVNLLTPLGLYDPLKAIFDTVCLSCFQFLRNSTFLNDLNAGGDAVPGVKYLMIASNSGFLRDKNPNVRNQVLQDLCALDISEHGLYA
ncbi:hypothetical protein BGW39_000839 [Mortierella sp. 14UC]|nr:hypothetical protein BGW39_000839 [Mortierella sp. 14UC]